MSARLFAAIAVVALSGCELRMHVSSTCTDQPARIELLQQCVAGIGNTGAMKADAYVDQYTACDAMARREAQRECVQ